MWLSKLAEKGFDTKLMDAINSFAPTSDQVVSEVVESVDKNGLKNPVILKLIGSMSKARKFGKDGLFGALVQLENDFNNSNGHNKVAEIPEVDVAPVTLSQDQEDQIKVRLEKERERLRKRFEVVFLKREAKLRENIALGKSIRSSGGRAPSGVPAEKMERWSELNGLIHKAKEIRKEQMKVMTDCKAEMATIRPPRVRVKRVKKEINPQ